MKHIKAFLTGMAEFRLSSTTSYDPPLIDAYDAGRDLAHRLTLRRWDDQ